MESLLITVNCRNLNFVALFVRKLNSKILKMGTTVTGFRTENLVKKLILLTTGALCHTADLTGALLSVHTDYQLGKQKKIPAI